MDNEKIKDILSEKDLEEYQSCVFAYKKYLDDISNLEKQKQKEPDLTGFWVLIGLLIILGVPSFVAIELKNILGDYTTIVTVLLFFGSIYFFDWIGKMATKSGVTNFVENILTFGKLKRVKEINNKINQKIDEIKKEKDNIVKQIRNFEQKIKMYYEDYLKEYYLENLYNKRSSVDGYEKSLEKFSSMVEEAESVNKMMIVEKYSWNEYYPLGEYKDYIKRKQIKIISQEQIEKVENKQLNYITPLGQKINRAIRNSTEPKKITPPEIRYRTARQIDWDAKNKERRLTGSQGEEIAMVLEREYLIQIGSPDLAERIRHVSKEMGDGLGYDILSFFPDGKEKYIEVKSTAKDTGSSFYVSKNELEFLQQNTKDSFVYRIFSVNNDDSNPSLEVVPAEEIISNGQIIPTQYLVKLQ